MCINIESLGNFEEKATLHPKKQCIKQRKLQVFQF